MKSLIEAARAAGASGQSWGSWSMSDEAQDAFAAADLGPLEQEAIEQAFKAGQRDRLAASGRVLWTTAPKDYDGGGTAELEVLGDYFGKPLRKIVVEPEDYEWQTDRYASGTYGVWEKDPIEEDRQARAKHEKHLAEMAAVAAKRAAGVEWLRTATEAQLENEDLCWEHGATWQVVRAEKTRRREAAGEATREAEWDRAKALIPEGATLIDDGAFIPGQHGLPSSTRPAHVYYDVEIVHGWPDDVEHAHVHEATGKGTKSFGTVAHVMSRFAAGHFRVARPGEVPPRAVVERIGPERLKDILRVETGGRVVWIGRALFGAKNLIVDENGRLVRAKKIVEAAENALQEKEAAQYRSAAKAAPRPFEGGSEGHAYAEPVEPRPRARKPRRRLGLRGRYGWYGERGRHAHAARKGWMNKRRGSAGRLK